MLDSEIPVCYTLTMMNVTFNKGDAMNETVQEFLNRGGKVTMCKDAKAYGAQKKQTTKIPARMGRKVVR
jgi:hypothetical protein